MLYVIIDKPSLPPMDPADGQEGGWWQYRCRCLVLFLLLAAVEDRVLGQTDLWSGLVQLLFMFASDYLKRGRFLAFQIQRFKKTKKPLMHVLHW